MTLFENVCRKGGIISESWMKFDLLFGIRVWNRVKLKVVDKNEL